MLSIAPNAKRFKIDYTVQIPQQIYENIFDMVLNGADRWDVPNISYFKWGSRLYGDNAPDADVDIVEFSNGSYHNSKISCSNVADAVYSYLSRTKGVIHQNDWFLRHTGTITAGDRNYGNEDTYPRKFVQMKFDVMLPNRKMGEIKLDIFIYPMSAKNIISRVISLGRFFTREQRKERSSWCLLEKYVEYIGWNGRMDKLPTIFDSKDTIKDTLTVVLVNESQSLDPFTGVEIKFDE